MQKFKDSQQLEAMYKMAGMGRDEDDDEEGPRAKKRKWAKPSRVGWTGDLESSESQEFQFSAYSKSSSS
jgi:hypothetical protein